MRGNGHHDDQAADAAVDPAILVVEDDVDIREVLAEVLTRAGYRVECAVNGAQAMDWVRSRRAGAPVLIILDIHMPVMDGRAFLAALAHEPAATPPAVLIFSASTPDARAFLGMPLVRGLLPKPAPARHILKTVAASWPEGAPPATA
jgi:CheY-like chemotaxis protein